MIGYYIHHQGRGHYERAAAVARATAEPIVALSSLPRPDDVAPFAGWVQLARDDVDPGAFEHAASGALHWAPLGSAGYRARMHRLASWLADAAPALVVVDVSVEVAVLCRTLGVPVVVVAGSGERPDPPHELVYRLAARIVAPWPGDLYRPAQLLAHADRTSYVGAFGRFDDRPVPASPGTSRVFVLWGAGGSEVGPAQIAAARVATPGWTWHAPGLDGTPWCEDVWASLTSADVVVTHGGMNAIAEVAAARRPAVVIPQNRPFGEQAATARVLAKNYLAVVAPRWPDAADWPGLLEDARRLGGSEWHAWNAGDGAARAAAAIEAGLPLSNLGSHPA